VYFPQKALSLPGAGFWAFEGKHLPEEKMPYPLKNESV